jgi:hypothetical protein
VRAAARYSATKWLRSAVAPHSPFNKGLSHGVDAVGNGTATSITVAPYPSGGGGLVMTEEIAMLHS